MVVVSEDETAVEDGVPFRDRLMPENNPVPCRGRQMITNCDKSQVAREVPLPVQFCLVLPS